MWLLSPWPNRGLALRRGIYSLLATQFLTAFADSAVFFVALEVGEKQLQVAPWFKPALQASFLLAFVFLAAWVGYFADKHIKSRVLAVGNVIKTVGSILMLLVVLVFAEYMTANVAIVMLLVAYAVIGIGAAVYGPAKYGILPELVGHNELVKANGLIEGSTIAAIVVGAVAGAYVVDSSVPWALFMVCALYLTSLAVTTLVPKTHARAAVSPGHILKHFFEMTRTFLTHPRARFAMLGTSVFWAASVALRVMLLTWAPVVLSTKTQTEVSLLVVFAAIGIAIGSILASKFISIDKLRRTRFAAYAMGASILLFWFVDTSTQAMVVLLLVGLAGGIFVVPINAALQEIGHQSVGSGSAVAIQHFFENLAMLIATGSYMVAILYGADPTVSLIVLGFMVLLAAFLVSWQLPADSAKENVLSEKDGTI